MAGGEGEAGETVGEGEDSEGGVIAEAGEASHQGNLLVVKAKFLNAWNMYGLSVFKYVVYVSCFRGGGDNKRKTFDD